MTEALAPLRCRVLVVDDCRDTTASTALLLRLWGCDVRVANDGPAALADAAAYPPDVVLLDLAMPCMDGCEVARRLRALPATAAVLLLSVSGYADPQHARLALAAGCDRHLSKPVDLEELRQLLAGHQPRGAPEGIA
jgi:CheY-like chemotaxis protein